MHYLLILLIVSLAVSALGWIYFIYFFSLGYGFGISAITYGNDPEFQKYIQKTPILLPFVPIYSLAKYEWLKA